MSNRGHQAGLGESMQAGFALDEAIAFDRMMRDLYDDQCAVTGDRPQDGVEVFLFQPITHGGTLSTGNALLVEPAVASLLGRGLILISDDFMAFTPYPEIIGAPSDPDTLRGRRLSLPDDVSRWPQRSLLSYHRSLFRAQ